MGTGRFISVRSACASLTRIGFGTHACFSLWKKKTKKKKKTSRVKTETAIYLHVNRGTTNNSSYVRTHDERCFVKVFLRIIASHTCEHLSRVTTGRAGGGDGRRGRPETFVRQYFLPLPRRARLVPPNSMTEGGREGWRRKAEMPTPFRGPFGFRSFLRVSSF